MRLTLSVSELDRNVAQFPQNAIKFWSDLSAKYVTDFLEHIHHSFNIFLNVSPELLIAHYTLVIILVKNMNFLNFRLYFWNFLAFRIQIMIDAKLVWISFSELWSDFSVKNQSFGLFDRIRKINKNHPEIFNIVIISVDHLWMVIYEFMVLVFHLTIILALNGFGLVIGVMLVASIRIWLHLDIILLISILSKTLDFKIWPLIEDLFFFLLLGMFLWSNLVLARLTMDRFFLFWANNIFWRL